MQSDDGAAGFAAVVTDLLTTTFGAARQQGNRQTLERRSGQGKRISVGQRHGRGIRPAAAFAERFLVDDAARDGTRDERAARRRPAVRLARGELAELMQTFPDKRRTEEKHG